MTTVFLSGSRKINRLNDVIRCRIRNIIEQEFHIIVGDANGADKAMQSYLADEQYQNVSIFCSGQTCRNNVGSWPSEMISVNSKLKGRAFYTQKDNAMAAKADFGLVLWDGKSEGSINNTLELLKNGKKSVVYFSPKKKFFKIKTPEDAYNLLQMCDSTAWSNLYGSKNIREKMEFLSISDQRTLTI